MHVLQDLRYTYDRKSYHGHIAQLMVYHSGCPAQWVYCYVCPQQEVLQLVPYLASVGLDSRSRINPPCVLEAAWAPTGWSVCTQYASGYSRVCTILHYAYIHALMLCTHRLVGWIFMLCSRGTSQTYATLVRLLCAIRVKSRCPEHSI